MATVSLRQVSKKFGAVEALRDVSLDIVSGEFVTLGGPSGCGKSTTLRIMAGLTAPEAKLRVRPVSGSVRSGSCVARWAETLVISPIQPRRASK